MPIVSGPELDSPVLAGLPLSDRTVICGAARAKQFGRGSMLYCEGDPVQQVFLLSSGIVKINKLGLSGTEVIVRLAVPGDSLGAAALFSTGEHGTAAQAFRQCQALAWNAATFTALLKRFPTLLQNVLHILCEERRELEERFQEMASETVGARVARQLLRLREKIGRKVNQGIQIDVSRDELARMTGTTLFTVSRLLSGWERQAIVKPMRESVVVLRIEALSALSQESRETSLSRH